jgi:hypothetical protein
MVWVLNHDVKLHRDFVYRFKFTDTSVEYWQRERILERYQRSSRGPREHGHDPRTQ